MNYAQWWQTFSSRPTKARLTSQLSQHWPTCAKTARSNININNSQRLWSVKPCPHCRRKLRLSQKTARQRRQSHFCETVSLICDSVDSSLYLIKHWADNLCLLSFCTPPPPFAPLPSPLFSHGLHFSKLPILAPSELTKTRHFVIEKSKTPHCTQFSDLPHFGTAFSATAPISPKPLREPYALRTLS